MFVQLVRVRALGSQAGQMMGPGTNYGYGLVAAQQVLVPVGVRCLGSSVNFCMMCCRCILAWHWPRLTKRTHVHMHTRLCLLCTLDRLSWLVVECDVVLLVRVRALAESG